MPTVAGVTAPVEHVVDRIENAGPLDPVTKVVRKAVNAALRPRVVRDALHGVWLGHPLHPVLTDVPIGAWSAAGILDLVPGTGPAASTLIAVGCAAAVPTAVTGLADWAQLHPPQQRVGVVHAAANVVGLSLYTGSLAARMSGRPVRGRLLGFAGLGAVMIGGYLGGHLAFRQSAGANHNADVIDLFPSGWQDLGPLDDLPEGQLTKRTVEGVDLLVIRRGQHLDVLANRCSHLSGPLSDGEFVSEGGQGCVICPWHGSTFRLADGAVVHGPATSPQQRFETRVTAGRVEARLPQG
jgi:nitrite reductase/ring-hydroxylating ferredoxin subunit